MTQSITGIVSTLPPSLPTDSLISKMRLQTTKVSWIFLEFLTRAEAQALRTTSKTCSNQITPAQFVRIQLERRGVVKPVDLEEYEKIAGATLASSKIFHLHITHHTFNPITRISHNEDAQVVATLNCFPEVQRLTLEAHMDSTNFGKSLIFDRIINLDLGSNSFAVTDDPLSTYLKRFPNLEILSLSGCFHLTNVDFQHAMDQTPRLKSLSLSYSDGQFGRFQVTDDDLLHMANRCRDLESLDIQKCNHITGENLRRVVDLLPRLISLYLIGCQNISGEDLIYIAKKRPHLQILEVGESNLTGHDLAAVSDLLPNLKVFTIRNCFQFKSDELRHIVTKCSKLQYLDIGGCFLFPSEDLTFVVDGCPALRTFKGSVSLINCTGSDLKNALKEQLPKYEREWRTHQDWIRDMGIMGR